MPFQSHWQNKTAARLRRRYGAFSVAAKAAFRHGALAMPKKARYV